MVTPSGSVAGPSGSHRKPAIGDGSCFFCGLPFESLSSVSSSITLDSISGTYTAA